MNEERKPGGLYRNVKVSVKTVNWLILFGIFALITVTLFLVGHNGFTVSFDSGGGTHIESIKVYYGDVLPVLEAPKREGYRFTGWYLDRDCRYPWNISTDTVTDSMTLYAGWEEAKAIALASSHFTKIHNM